MKLTNETIFETIKLFDELAGVPDAYGLADKMLPIFVEGFLIVSPTHYELCQMYKCFDRFLYAVNCVVVYERSYEETAVYFNLDADNLKKAVELIKSKASVSDIVMYLD